MAEEIEMAQHTVSLVRPTGSTADLVQNMKSYQDLCVALLDDNDWQTIQGKRFPKRSAWRKLAVAYGVSFEIKSAIMNRDEEGNLRSAEFVVRATAPNGRHSDGWGACAVSERNAGRKAEHDIPATAETRAKNRAAADLFGMGEVSAEEIDRNAMYINDDQQSKLREKIAILGHDQRATLMELWKDSKLPKLEFLNDDQLEQVYTYLDNVVDSDPVIQEQQEAF
jgi:hypothetical protein|tara:strand:+ start:156 stop:827 length:672 start_codon:yes stop_codon:yes gene_type:complete